MGRGGERVEVSACLANRPSERAGQIPGGGVEHHPHEKIRSGPVVLPSAYLEPSTRQIQDRGRPPGGALANPGGGDQQVALQLDRGTLVAAAVSYQGAKRRTRLRSIPQSRGDLVRRR